MICYKFNVAKPKRKSKLFVRCMDAHRNAFVKRRCDCGKHVRILINRNDNWKNGEERRASRDERRRRRSVCRCHGQSSCQLRLNNEIFTDPCGSNIPKHFEIHYRCINPGKSIDSLFSSSTFIVALDELCPSLLFNCSKTKDLSCLSQLREDYFCSCPSTVCQLNSSNEPIAFHPLTCRAEVFHGIQWLTTPVLKGQSVLCPSPCSTGKEETNDDAILVETSCGILNYRSNHSFMSRKSTMGWARLHIVSMPDRWSIQFANRIERLSLSMFSQLVNPTCDERSMSVGQCRVSIHNEETKTNDPSHFRLSLIWWARWIHRGVSHRPITRCHGHHVHHPHSPFNSKISVGFSVQRRNPSVHTSSF